MTKDEIVAALKDRNANVPEQRLHIFADALIDYHAAQANIDEHGTVVTHPRTGAPIMNPYLPIRAQAAKQLLSLRIDSTGLWNSGR